MSCLKIVFFAMILLAGCGGPTFTNLGNGVGVPPEVIEDYAAANEITREEARSRMRKHFDQQRIADYANEHDVTLEEAKKQLDHEVRPGAESTSSLRDEDSAAP